MHRTALAFALLTFASPLEARAEGSRVPPAEGSSGVEYQAPHVVPYEGGAIPSNARLETRPNTKLVGAGVIVAGALYGLSLIYALGTCGAQMECRSGSAWLYVPIVGPYFTAANAPTSGGKALSTFDGAVQTVGLGLIVAGLALPRKFVVWESAHAAVDVAPAPIASGAGLALRLTQL